MHVNFGAYGDTFDLYLYALFAAALVSIFMSIAGFGATTGARVATGLVGLAALGYGSYLAFFFNGGHYWISMYVFALPILAIVNAVRSRGGRSAHTPQGQAQWPPSRPQQPQQPGWGPPPQQGPANGPNPYGQHPNAAQYGAPQYAAPQPGQQYGGQQSSPQPYGSGQGGAYGQPASYGQQPGQPTQGINNQFGQQG
jgi:hypothetical protein